RHNVEATVELTLRHAQARYRNSPRYRREQQALLLNSFERGCLIGIGLWSGSALVASVLAFTDTRRRELCAYKTTFNIKFADASPGIAAAGFMIRHAIDQGYEIYDFSRGGERYKFLFGTLLRYTKHFTVTRLGARSAFGNAVRPFIRAPGRLAEKVLSRVPA
ncbi:MAG: GNAT family N-acetyltransferase, partial [Candidatus Eremiobacteraeota bacterium]|nr:GNAT family N-acetyltransferase [Candidatus Eremiobacteraeota bacterium]